MSYDRKLLAIYLNDHLAGATVGRELAKRALGENSDNEFAASLGELSAQIEQDRETLVEVMRRLDVREDPVKRVAAVVAERLGRFKLNGSWTSYSPLSRVVELEALMAGVDGKRSLWNLLLELELPELADFDFDALSMRASEQHAALSALKQEAGHVAIAPSGVEEGA